MTFQHHISLPFFSLISLFSLFTTAATQQGPSDVVAPSGGGGAWVLLQKTIGVSAMHIQLMKNNKVVIFDRTGCSSGAVHPDGRLVQTGGYNAGERKIRLFTPSNTTTNNSAAGAGLNGVFGGDGDNSDWVELPPATRPLWVDWRNI